MQILLVRHGQTEGNKIHRFVGGRTDEPAGFFCAACAVVYPVRDGIPVMLLEEAVPLERWRVEHPAA